MTTSSGTSIRTQVRLTGGLPATAHPEDVKLACGDRVVGVSQVALPDRDGTGGQVRRYGGWACPGEPAGRLRRTGDQPGGHVPGDPQGICAVLDAIDRLADDPPGPSFPHGSPDLRL